MELNGCFFLSSPGLWEDVLHYARLWSDDEKKERDETMQEHHVTFSERAYRISGTIRPVP